MTVYFDNAATTKISPAARAAVISAFDDYGGNPSSGHKLGRDAAAALKNARSQVAQALGCDASEVYFTSGGTEADNWAVFGAAELMRHKGCHIITTQTEHDAVRQPVKVLENKGYDVTYLSPDKSGRISKEDVAAAIREDTVLVSVMMVNNETGAKNPVEEISRVIKEKKSSALLHTDGVQGFLKVPFTAKKLGADLISISSHKIHGPKGIGALYIRRGVRLPAILFGGGQEGALRPGTEAVPNILGFGAAAEEGRRLFEEADVNMRGIRDYLKDEIVKRMPFAVITGEGDAPHILSVSLPGYKSEVIMNLLDANGICVSKSSACKKGARSHVLEAMKLSADIIDGTIRISLSRFSTMKEAEYFIDVLEESSKRLKTVLGKR